MANLDVVLSDDEHAALLRLVAQGGFASAQDAVRAGLRLVAHRVDVQRAEAALQEAVALGFADLDAGRYIQLDTKEELHDFFETLWDDAIARAKPE